MRIIGILSITVYVTIYYICVTIYMFYIVIVSVIILCLFKFVIVCVCSYDEFTLLLTCCLVMMTLGSIICIG